MAGSSSPTLRCITSNTMRRRERVPVGVKAGRVQADQQVAALDARAVDDAVPVDDPDYEACEVVLARGVEIRHLSGLAAQKRAGVRLAGERDAPHDLVDDMLVHLSRREIVEEEDGARSLHQDVVDAVVHEALAYRVVPSRREGELQFRSGAVCAGDEHLRVLAFGHLVQPPK